MAFRIDDVERAREVVTLAERALEPAQANLPSIFVAVKEQLGLKLERTPHGTVEYVIIAKAHAPTED